MFSSSFDPSLLLSQEAATAQFSVMWFIWHLTERITEKNAVELLNVMKKSRSQMNTSKVLLRGTFSHGWGWRGERRCLGACIVALYVLQWEIKFTRTVGRVETVKPQATLVYAAEPQHPRDQNLGHILVLPYNMTKWPLRSTASDQNARREKSGYPKASGTGLQFLSI